MEFLIDVNHSMDIKFLSRSFTLLQWTDLIEILYCLRIAPVRTGSLPQSIVEALCDSEFKLSQFGTGFFQTIR